MTSSQSPLFIVVEGLDGVGKSTVVQRLAESLDAVLLRTPQTELLPMRTDILRCFAESPLATTLFYAATLAAASQQVAASRALGRTVVMDRYYLTTCVYGQTLRAEQHPHALLARLAEHLLAPDVTVYLFAQSEERHNRMKARGHIGKEDQLSFDPRHSTRLDAAYQQLSTHPLVGRWLSIDTSKLPLNDVMAQLLAALPGGAP